jgi:uncharacterized protein YuzE
MLVEYDNETETTRFYVSDFPGLDPTAETLEVSPDVVVDIDLDGQPVSVEVQLRPAKIDAAVLGPLRARFPDLTDDVLHARDNMMRTS